MASELISVVVPARDEEQILPALHGEVAAALGSAGLDFELIIIDDGSTDETAAVIERLAAEDPRVRGIHLARSFGHQFALLAGLEDARGDAVVTIDADLEQPPAAILDLVARWREGFQVVHGVRRDHPGAPWFKRTTSRWFYRLFAFLSHIPMEPGMLDFRLMDRRVVDAVLAHTESDFFLRGIASWVGFRQARVPYRSGLRSTGRTKFTTRRMIGFAVRGITSFSVFPLRLATWLGAFMTLLSLAFGVFVGIRYFFWEHPQPGYASTILLISFLFGVQFLLIGLLGEYVARIHVEVKKRPRYLVARRTGEPRERPERPR